MAFTPNDMKKRHGSQKMSKVALYLLSDRILMVRILQVSSLLQTKNMRSNYANFAAKDVVPLPVKTGKLRSSLTFDITRVPPARKKSFWQHNKSFIYQVCQAKMARNFIHPPNRELLLLHVLQNYKKKKQNERNTNIYSRVQCRVYKRFILLQDLTGSISFAMRLCEICKNCPTIKSIAIMEYAIAKILVCAEGAWSALNFLHGKKV